MTRPPGQSQSSLPRLTALHPLARLGISVLVVVLLAGYVVSGVHMAWHYERRDSRPGLTIHDITAAYHGINAPSPLVEALRRGHPEALTPSDRERLINWLAGPRIDQDYDDLDLGDDAPSEIIAASCMGCHARNASGPEAFPRLPLEYWDDVRSVAYSVVVQPNDRKIIAASLHAHAPSMSVILLVLGGLALMTRFPAWLTGGVLSVAAVGLLCDMGGQWLARDHAAWVYAIVAGGFVYAAGTALLGLMVIAGCWLPRSQSERG